MQQNPFSFVPNLATFADVITLSRDISKDK